MEMLTCPECGKENEIDSTICNGCGFPLKKIVRCPDCGAEYSEETDICTKCGCPLKETKPSTKPKISVKTIAIAFVALVAILIVFFGVNKSKNDFRDMLISGSPWTDAATDDTVKFNDEGIIMCYSFGHFGGVHGDLEFRFGSCEYKVKSGNKISIGGTTVDVSFSVDGKIVFEPEIYPLIKQNSDIEGAYQYGID